MPADLIPGPGSFGCRSRVTHHSISLLPSIIIVIPSMLTESTCVASVFVGLLPIHASRSRSTTSDGSTLARARLTSSLWPKDPSLIWSSILVHLILAVGSGRSRLILHLDSVMSQ